VLTFEPHPREFFAPEAAPSRLSTLREKLELLADDGVEAGPTFATSTPASPP
jgi:riboflavin kinase/FMN adenylyltransferase